MTRAFLYVFPHPQDCSGLLGRRKWPCVACMAALQQCLFPVRRKLVFWNPSKRCTSSRRASHSDGPLLLPRDVCRNSGTPPPPSRCSVLFRKACRTSSRGRLFRFEPSGITVPAQAVARDSHRRFNHHQGEDWRLRGPNRACSVRRSRSFSSCSTTLSYVAYGNSRRDVYPIDISRAQRYVNHGINDAIRRDADGAGSSIPEQSKPSYPSSKGCSFA